MQRIRVTKEIRDRVHDLSGQGFTQTKVGLLVGISQSSVGNILLANRLAGKQVSRSRFSGFVAEVLGHDGPITADELLDMAKGHGLRCDSHSRHVDKLRQLGIVVESTAVYRFRRPKEWDAQA